MSFDSQLGDDFGQQGPTFDAPPPPPADQPRPSMADEFAATIFGDPNPSMTSSSHTGPGSHWAAPHDYVPSDDQ
jgi:hypothetical protein